jgi:hypothetical protein
LPRFREKAVDGRDLELLQKQVGHIGPTRRNDGILIVALTVVFFAGVALGGFLFTPPQNKPPVQTAAAPTATLAR